MSLAELQLERLTRGLRALLGSNLAGAYLHGSLAMGGFEPARSDIDVLVVVHRPLHDDGRANLARLLLDVSLAPHPIEISVVTTADVALLRHPLPYEWHYGESRRERYRDRPSEAQQRPGEGDPDLVAHVLVTRRRGRVLAGAATATYLPTPSRAAVADSLWQDLGWALDQAADAPSMARYVALNAARALAWITDDAVLSKAEGAAQAARHLQGDVLALVNAAAVGDITADAPLDALVLDVRARLAAIVAAGNLRPVRTTPNPSIGAARDVRPA